MAKVSDWSDFLTVVRDGYINGTIPRWVLKSYSDPLYKKYGVNLIDFLGEEEIDGEQKKKPKKKSSPKPKKPKVTDDDKNEMYEISFWRATDRVDHVDPYK